MQTSVIGYPRVGALRELKFATEKYFRGEINEQDLQQTAKDIRRTQWQRQKDAGIDLIPSNDFSFYDNVLDAAVLFHIVPQRYEQLNLSPLAQYFAMARGYQGTAGDVKAFAMKKWFDTNYHYMVPEISDDTEISLVGTKPFDEFLEAKALGIVTKPVIVGPFTLLKLLTYTGNKHTEQFARPLAQAYALYLERFNQLGAQWVQFDKRERIQKTEFQLPLFPTTTIGSFPQTADVKSSRKAFRTGKLSAQEYTDFCKSKIAKWVKWQEDVDLDVLVHGEFEKNDMAEYFGEQLNGYLFTEKAWVQSYGTRCVQAADHLGRRVPRRFDDRGLGCLHAEHA